MSFHKEAQIIRDNFFQELTLAADGKTSSLRFIRNQLSPHETIHDDEIFQVLVIGGSVFRKAKIKKEQNAFIILESSEEDVPLFTTKEIFLTFITEHMYSGIPHTVINFAYPLSPTIRDNRLDGKLLSGSKENQFDGLINYEIGKEIELFVREKKQQTIIVSLANDAVCLLLSGLPSYPKDSLVGAIMGTGTNMTFFYEGFAVNLESGNFDKFPPTDECRSIDTASHNPGKGLFEKEVAGAYLYQHFNMLVKKQSLSFPELNSTKELQDLALESGESDASALAKGIFDKAGALFAGQLAGMAAFKKQPITVIMEGSLYWKNPLYQEYVKNYLAILSTHLPVLITKIDNSPLIGGASLVA